MFVKLFRKTRKYRPPKRRRRFGGRLLDGLLRAVVALGLIGLACLIGGVVWAFLHFLYRSDYFDIRDVVISPLLAYSPSGDEPLEPEEGFDRVRDEVERELHREGLHEGNLLSLDADAVRRVAESHGKVRKAVVRKRYPGLLEIDLALRKTVAFLPLRDALVAVDRDGFPIERLTTRDARASRHPYITGLSLEGAELGTRVESESLTKALGLLSLLRIGAPVLARKTSEVHCGESESLTLLLEGGTEIRFGTGDPADRMPALETFVREMGRPEQFAYIDLWVDGQVPYKRKEKAPEEGPDGPLYP